MLIIMNQWRAKSRNYHYIFRIFYLQLFINIAFNLLGLLSVLFVLSIKLCLQTPPDDVTCHSCNLFCTVDLKSTELEALVPVKSYAEGCLKTKNSIVNSLFSFFCQCRVEGRSNLLTSEPIHFEGCLPLILPLFVFVCS